MREIIINGVIGWDTTAKEVRKALAEANGAPVVLKINSPGGFVFEGIEIYNAIRAYKGKTQAVITGLAASMGSYIALAAGKVTAMSNATYMIHNALAVAVGNHNDLRKTAAHLESISQLLANAYQAKTGKSMREVRRMMDAESFFYGGEIKDAGFADDVRKAEPDAPAETQDKDTAIATARGNLAAMFANMRESAEVAADLARAVAILDPSAKQADLLAQDGETGWEPQGAEPENKAANSNANPALASGVISKTEVKTVKKLQDVLNEFPELRPELDAMIAGKVTEARTEAQATAQATAKVIGETVAAFLAPEAAYPKTIKALALDVLKGAATVDTLKATATAYEAMQEAHKTDAAKAETDAQKDTPPSDGAAKAAKSLKTYEETGAIDSAEALAAHLKA